MTSGMVSVAVVVVAGAFAVVVVAGGACSACRAFSSTSALLRVMAETFESAMVVDSSSSVKLEAGLPWMLCGRGAFMRNLSKPNCCSVSTLTSGPGVRARGSLVSVGSAGAGARGGSSPVNAGSLGVNVTPNSCINPLASFHSASVSGVAVWPSKLSSLTWRGSGAGVTMFSGTSISLRLPASSLAAPVISSTLVAWFRMDCARPTRAVCVGLMMFASYD